MSLALPSFYALRALPFLGRCSSWQRKIVQGRRQGAGKPLLAVFMEADNDAAHRLRCALVGCSSRQTSPAARSAPFPALLCPQRARAPHPRGPLRARADCLMRRRPGSDYELHELHTSTACQTVVRPARCPALAQRAFCLACNWVQPLLRACSPAGLPPAFSRRVCAELVGLTRARSRALHAAGLLLCWARARGTRERAGRVHLGADRAGQGRCDQADRAATRDNAPRCTHEFGLCPWYTPPLGGARLGCKHFGPRCRRMWHGLSRHGLSRHGLSRHGLSRCGLSRCGRMRFSLRRGRTGWHAARSHGLATWHAARGHKRHVRTQYVRTRHISHAAWSHAARSAWSQCPRRARSCVVCSSRAVQLFCANCG